jgi:hypothetical protein
VSSAVASTLATEWQQRLGLQSYAAVVGGAVAGGLGAGAQVHSVHMFLCLVRSCSIHSLGDVAAPCGSQCSGLLLQVVVPGV